MNRPVNVSNEAHRSNSTGRRRKMRDRHGSNSNLSNVNSTRTLDTSPTRRRPHSFDRFQERFKQRLSLNRKPTPIESENTRLPRHANKHKKKMMNNNGVNGKNSQGNNNGDNKNGDNKNGNNKGNNNKTLLRHGSGVSDSSLRSGGSHGASRASSSAATRSPVMGRKKTTMTVVSPGVSPTMSTNSVGSNHPAGPSFFIPGINGPSTWLADKRHNATMNNNSKHTVRSMSTAETVGNSSAGTTPVSPIVSTVTTLVLPKPTDVDVPSSLVISDKGNPNNNESTTPIEQSPPRSSSSKKSSSSSTGNKKKLAKRLEEESETMSIGSTAAVKKGRRNTTRDKAGLMKSPTTNKDKSNKSDGNKRETPKKKRKSSRSKRRSSQSNSIQTDSPSTSKSQQRRSKSQPRTALTGRQQHQQSRDRGVPLHPQSAAASHKRTAVSSSPSRKQRNTGSSSDSVLPIPWLQQLPSSPTSSSVSSLSTLTSASRTVKSHLQIDENNLEELQHAMMWLQKRVEKLTAQQQRQQPKHPRQQLQPRKLQQLLLQKQHQQANTASQLPAMLTLSTPEEREMMSTQRLVDETKKLQQIGG